MEATIKQAIEESQMRDRIVELAEADLTAQDLQDLACESWDSAENGVVHEYWGQDDGGEWRIHVVLASQEVAYQQTCGFENDERTPRWNESACMGSMD